MKKKVIIFGVIILIVVVGGIFYWWWQEQEDVRELNKNLPEEVRVVKNLAGEYWVKNKIDGYEFKVPEEWKGIEEIEYVPSTPEEKYSRASINVEGLEGFTRFTAIDQFKVKEELSLESVAKKIFEEYELTGEFASDKVGDIDVVKTQENVHLVGMYVYFFKKNSVIYAITGGSEEFIQEIITNGRW